jgi:DUF971 family protein
LPTIIGDDEETGNAASTRRSRRWQLVAIDTSRTWLWTTIEEITTMTAMVTPTVTDYELSADLSELFMRASDDHAISFSAERLRAACKCAHCTRARIDERFPARFPGIAIVGITDLGYGLNIAFSDGHWRGIYPKSYLLDLASH